MTMLQSSFPQPTPTPRTQGLFTLPGGGGRLFQVLSRLDLCPGSSAQLKAVRAHTGLELTGILTLATTLDLAWCKHGQYEGKGVA